MSEQKFVDFSIQIKGAVYRTLLTKNYQNRVQWEKANPKIMKAFIPGTIKDVSIKKGTKVKEGDQLLILEAMKMENQILAPFDGVIAKVNVKEGEVVSKNHILVEMK